MVNFRNPDSQAYKDEKKVYEDYTKGMIDAVDFEKTEEVHREFLQVIGSRNDNPESVRMASRIGLFRALTVKAIEEEADQMDSVPSTIEFIDAILKLMVNEYKAYLAKNLSDEEVSKITVNEKALTQVFETRF